MRNYPAATPPSPRRGLREGVRSGGSARMPGSTCSLGRHRAHFDAAVAWVNVRRKAYLLKICTDQKERARDVLKMKGGRTKL